MIGRASALASLATAAGAISFRFLAEPGTHKLLSASFGLAAAGLATVAVADTVPLAIADAVIASAGTGILLPTLLTWAVSGLAFKQRGRGTGIWTGSLFVGQFLIPVVVGMAAAAMCNLDMALAALGIACAVAVIAVIIPARRSVVATN